MKMSLRARLYHAVNFQISIGIMAIIPAHQMRSMAGGFDNECVAVTAILLTFYFWLLSIRTPSSWPFGTRCNPGYCSKQANK